MLHPAIKSHNNSPTSNCYAVAALLPVALLSACSSAPDPAMSDLSMIIGEEDCSHFGTKHFATMVVENNNWHAAATLPEDHYSQCIFTLQDPSQGIAGWRWSYPGYAMGVNGYPEIIYGWKPWHTESTSEELPLKLDVLGSIVVDYEVDYHSVNGTYNTAFDIWITDSPNVTPSAITFELMIWENTNRLAPFGNYQGDLETRSGVYAFFMGQPDWEPEGSNWTYLAFVRKSNRHQGHIFLEDFIEYLTDKNIVSSAEYLASIEFGNEVGPGSGATIVKKFDIVIGP